MAKILEVINETRSENQEARESLLLFTEQTKPRYRTNWHHEELAKRLDRVARGECQRLMVFMPPQHGKSELVSRRFPAFMLGRNPDLRLIACSHTHDLAVSMNRDVQRIMTGKLKMIRFQNHAALRMIPNRARHKNATDWAAASSVRERKPLPENELRVCCRRLSGHVSGQFVARELGGTTVSRLQETSCVGNLRGCHFFLSNTGVGQNHQRRCALR